VYPLFRDRIEAGKGLVQRLQHYANRDDVVVLALPRGGVPVGFEVSIALRVPLDVFLVRKLGVPGQEEVAMGAIASGGITVFNEDIIQSLHISSSEIDAIKAHEQAIIEKREALYRGSREFIDLKNKTVLLIDDGIATGATIRAAIAAIRRMPCDKIVVAIPVAPKEIGELLLREVDELVCLEIPDPFYAIGLWYENFSQTSDDEVTSLLFQAHQRPSNEEIHDE